MRLFRLWSPDVEPGEAIPRFCTCEGEDSSPTLEWEHPPAGTKSFALIVDDPDAPDPHAPRVTWVHWVLYNLPATTSSLPRGVDSGGLPRGARQGLNDWRALGYRGPCPPIGRHRYSFRLYALDTVLRDEDGLSKGQLVHAMRDHVLGEAELVGTYMMATPRS